MDFQHPKIVMNRHQEDLVPLQMIPKVDLCSVKHVWIQLNLDKYLPRELVERNPLYIDHQLPIWITIHRVDLLQNLRFLWLSTQLDHLINIMYILIIHKRDLQSMPWMLMPQTHDLLILKPLVLEHGVLVVVLNLTVEETEGERDPVSRERFT